MANIIYPGFLIAMFFQVANADAGNWTATKVCEPRETLLLYKDVLKQCTRYSKVGPKVCMEYSTAREELSLDVEDLQVEAQSYRDAIDKIEQLCISRVGAWAANAVYLSPVSSVDDYCYRNVRGGRGLNCQPTDSPSN